jgi:hypothetical protein
MEEVDIRPKGTANIGRIFRTVQLLHEKSAILFVSLRENDWKDE